MTKGYLIDMDGVIYRGSTMIPGAMEFIKQLQRAGGPFLFLTNNSERSPKDLVAKFGHFGLKVSWKNFYTAAHCTADFLVRQQPTSSAFVIGEGGLIVALQEAGIAFDSIKPDFVVVDEGLRTNETIMIGDTMETDIRGAVELGIPAYLVLTGSTKRETVAQYPYQPTGILNSIADLLDLEESVIAHAEEATVGGMRG